MEKLSPALFQYFCTENPDMITAAPAMTGARMLEMNAKKSM
jgi:hypothetical protein